MTTKRQSRGKDAATRLSFPALKIRQSKGRWLYSFAIDGKLLPKVATVSRIHRNDEVVAGYQRPEVVAHIAEIREYLESESPMIPNAIVVAFDSRVKFKRTPAGGGGNAQVTMGTITIPLDEDWDNADKPGFVVDGQQRIAAIRDAEISKFPICVTAFITDDLQEQMEQFILVNATKPLPKGLLYELLPSTSAKLPRFLHRRRFPATLLNHLNYNAASPLKGMIHTPTNPDGIIKDNSLLRMLENSLSDGVLYEYRIIDGEDDVAGMLEVLYAFWGAVREVFPEVWGLPPKKSRLMHGAGIVSMGFVMDAIAGRHSNKTLTLEIFRKDLEPLVECCRWDNGFWDFGPGMQFKWNEIQNTNKHIVALSNYLMAQYKERVWNKQRKRRRKRSLQQALPL